ncbi:MAG TPA: Dickkopf N-terminal cysteine-rich domain-containing protein [Polyangiaceae bacterium]|jgi:hypothetical protein
MKKLAFATACLGLLVGVACSSGSGGGGGGAASNGSAFAQDFCNLIEPCCAQAGLGTTGTLCLAFADEAAESGTYDPAAGEACIAGMQAESGTPALCTYLGNDVPACSQAFRANGGSAPPGAACMQDSDCASAPGGGATCFTDFAFGDGGSNETQTCVQTMVGQAGQGPCIGIVEPSGTEYEWSGTGSPPSSGYTCATASGLTCDQTTQKCLALATTGAACSSDQDCVAADYCSFGGQGSACAVRFADGASCSADAEGCLATSYCDSSTMTCKPLLATGSSCTASQQCSSTQCVNDVCSGSNNLGLQLFCGTQ